MECVDGILEHLKPVVVVRKGCKLAIPCQIVGDDFFIGAQPFEDGESWEHRLPLCGPHVGPERSMTLNHRIPGLAYFVPIQDAVLRFARLFEAIALNVEQPAVIAAADAVLFDAAVVE